MALTLEHDRKQRIKKQAEEMQSLRLGEIDKVIDLAVKRFADKGTKGRGIIVDRETPEGQIEALDSYISDLRDIKEEMDISYGPGIERRLWLIDLEIDHAIEAIARLKMQQVSPGER
jgi:hypothetical protein